MWRQASKREVVVPDSDFKALLNLIPDPCFTDLVVVTWETGCRPQESLRVESRHVDVSNQRWVFSQSERQDGHSEGCLPDGSGVGNYDATGLAIPGGAPLSGIIFGAGLNRANFSFTNLRSAVFETPSTKLVDRGAIQRHDRMVFNHHRRLLVVVVYQSTTEPSSGSYRGRYSLGSPTSFISLSSSITIPRPGPFGIGR